MRSAERLKKIARLVDCGDSVADIGADHGYLAVELAYERKCPKVVITDISASSLDKARNNLADIKGPTEFDLRLGDGLSVLSMNEVDTIVIAGMGGLLISEIMGRNPELTASFSNFILQPRNNLGWLVYFLTQNGFTIEDEILAREAGAICEILLVNTPYSAIQATDVLSYNDFINDNRLCAKNSFPKAISKHKDRLTLEYLEKEKLKMQKIEAEMKKSRFYDGKYLKTEPYIAKINQLLRWVKNEEA